MGGAGSGAQRGGDQYGFGKFGFSYAVFLCTLRVGVEAVRALRRHRDGDRNQFAVLARDRAILAGDDLIEVQPSFEFLRRGVPNVAVKTPDDLDAAVALLNGEAA